MPKTPLTAAARWTGERFELDEMPAWLTRALGSGDLTFNGENLAIVTADGPVSAAPGDWVTVTADGLGTATDEDFNENYEITE